MSQIFNIGPSFHLMKCRNKFLKKLKKFPVFCHKIKTRTCTKILRHCSLHISVMYMVKSHEMDSLGVLSATVGVKLLHYVFKYS